MKKKTKKFLKNNLRFFPLYVGVIMVWRWIWNFLDYYFLPDYFNISNTLTIVIWLFIILLNDYDLDEVF